MSNRKTKFDAFNLLLCIPLFFFLINYSSINLIHASDLLPTPLKIKEINNNSDPNKSNQKNGENAELNIKYEKGLFSINVKDTKLLDIINRIVEITKIKIEIQTNIDKYISKMELSNVDIEKVLEKLIGIRNFIIEYKKDKENKLVISKIYILGQKGYEISKIRFDSEDIAQIIRCGENICFFDKSGNFIGMKEMPENSFIRFSKDYNTYGIQRILEVSENGYYPTKFEFLMYDKYGNLLWTNDFIKTDQFWISSASNGLAAWTDIWNDNILSFYNKNGLLKKTNPLGDKLQGDYSLDGNFFAVSVNDYNSHGNLLLYNNKGDLIFQKKYDERLDNVFISQKGELMVLIKTDNKKEKTYMELINNKGDPILISEVEHIGSYIIDMSKNNTQVAIANSSGKLYYLNISPQPSVAWEFSAPSNMKLWDIAISSQGNLIAGALSSQGPLEKDPKPRYVYLFDKKGNILKEIKYDIHGFKAWDEVPNPIFSLDNKKLIVSLKETIKSYNIEEFIK